MNSPVTSVTGLTAHRRAIVACFVFRQKNSRKAVDFFDSIDPKLPFLTAWADSRVGWKADIRTVLLRMLTYPIRVGICLRSKLHSQYGDEPPNCGRRRMRVRSDGFACSEGAHDAEGRATAHQVKIGPVETADRGRFPGAGWHRILPLRSMQVSMQLKWKHQFQFAGYYQALEQGFYRDAGLDVTIREGGPDIDVAEAVASGKADFGVCSSSVLRDWAAGRRLVVLAAIFQHSPAVILVRAPG